MDPDGRRQTHTTLKAEEAGFQPAVGYPGGPSKEPRLLANCLLSILVVVAVLGSFLSLCVIFHPVCLTKKAKRFLRDFF